MTKFRDIIKNIDKPLFLITLVLFTLGLIMVFSASNVTSYMNGGSPYDYFFRQGLFLLASFILCIFIIKFNISYSCIYFGIIINLW